MRFAVCLVVFVMIWGVLPAAAQETVTGELEHLNWQRSYSLYVPASYDAATPAPLVVVLHGAGGTGAEMLEFTQITKLADESGYLVLFPEGIDESWGFLDKRELDSADLYTNDWDFVDVLITQISTEYSVDATRVYMLGFSNGGLLALRYLCEHSERVAAVAVFAATFNNYLAQHCNNARPTSLMLVLGTKDRAFPFQGSAEIKSDGRVLISLSVQQAMFYMADLNGCDLTAGNTEAVSITSSPVQVVRDSYGACRNNTTLELYALIDYEHRYPFEPIVKLDELDTIGNIEAAAWQFFAAHTRE